MSRAMTQNVSQLERQIRKRLRGRLPQLELLAYEEGLVLIGRARSYYEKQLAQQAVMEATSLRLLANEIKVP